MKIDRPIHRFLATVAVVAWLGHAGCAPAVAPSTHVTPPSDHRVHLVLQQGVLSVFKDGETRLLHPKGDPELILRCDPGAALEAARARKDYKSSARLNTTGLVFITIGTIAGSISVYYVVIGLVPLLIVDGIGVSFMGGGASKENRALAQYVDAVNMHNDAAACLRATQEVAVTPPTAAPGAEGGR